MQPKIVETKIVRWFSAGAITVFPFIFIDPLWKLVSPSEYQKIITHESVHINQQLKWFKYGFIIGLLAWYLIYLLCLPVGWNYFRYKWEEEAYKAEGFNDITIHNIMKQAPYYLWWM